MWRRQVLGAGKLECFIDFLTIAVVCLCVGVVAECAE